MTFEIRKAGFYTNRRGKKIEIIGQASSGQWWNTDGKGYHDDGRRIDRDYEQDDIISPWTEPLELEEFEKTTYEGWQEKLKTIPSCALKPTGKGKKFYLVFNPSQSAPKYKHTTKEEAITEAKRVAGKHPKQNVFVLETITCFNAEVKVNEVEI
jgi:hypothetical protein